VNYAHVDPAQRVDAVVFGPQADDRSEGRWPDGTQAIHLMQPPTPGAPNRVLQVFAVSEGSGAFTVQSGAFSFTD
jgi:hypothetical protein